MHSPVVRLDVVPSSNRERYEKSLIGQLFGNGTVVDNGPSIPRSKEPPPVKAKPVFKPHENPGARSAEDAAALEPSLSVCCSAVTWMWNTQTKSIAPSSSSQPQRSEDEDEEFHCLWRCQTSSFKTDEHNHFQIKIIFLQHPIISTIDTFFNLKLMFPCIAPPLPPPHLPCDSWWTVKSDSSTCNFSVSITMVTGLTFQITAGLVEAVTKQPLLTILLQ